MSKSIFFVEFSVSSIFFLLVDFQFKSIIKIGMIGITTDSTEKVIGKVWKGLPQAE